MVVPLNEIGKDICNLLKTKRQPADKVTAWQESVSDWVPSGSDIGFIVQLLKNTHMRYAFVLDCKSGFTSALLRHANCIGFRAYSENPKNTYYRLRKFDRNHSPLHIRNVPALTAVIVSTGDITLDWNSIFPSLDSEVVLLLKRGDEEVPSAKNYRRFEIQLNDCESAFGGEETRTKLYIYLSKDYLLVDQPYNRLFSLNKNLKETDFKYKWEGDIKKKAESPFVQFKASLQKIIDNRYDIEYTGDFSNWIKKHKLDKHLKPSNPLGKNKIECPQSYVTLYHFTIPDNLEQIGREGLKASASPNSRFEIDSFIDSYAPNWAKRKGILRCKSVFASMYFEPPLSSKTIICLELKLDPKDLYVVSESMAAAALSSKDEYRAKHYWNTLEPLDFKKYYGKRMKGLEVLIPRPVKPEFIRIVRYAEVKREVVGLSQ